MHHHGGEVSKGACISGREASTVFAGASSDMHVENKVVSLLPSISLPALDSIMLTASLKHCTPMSARRLKPERSPAKLAAIGAVVLHLPLLSYPVFKKEASPRPGSISGGGEGLVLDSVGRSDSIYSIASLAGGRA